MNRIFIIVGSILLFIAYSFLVCIAHEIDLKRNVERDGCYKDFINYEFCKKQEITNKK